MGKFRETLAEGTEGALHLGPERDRVFADLTPEEKKRYKADIRATNILLQGLRKDICTLIHHYTDAKDIWDNMKMLLEGSELTKDERESQLYDDLEHFHQNKGEMCLLSDGCVRCGMIDDLGEEDIDSLLNSFNATIKNIEEGILHNSDLKMVHESTKATKIVSFSNVLMAEKTQSQPKVNFRKMNVTSLLNADYEAMIHVLSVLEVNKRLSNSIYGYFIGKRIMFPMVENYVFNAWGKYGIQKIIMNAKGFYFFKFSSKKGVEYILENGPWTVRAIPIILNKWTPSSSLTKENQTRVPILVKIHDVPLAAFTTDGLSVIASKLKETVTVAVPNLEDEGYTCEKVMIEYEWRPHQCLTCKMFCHSTEMCPISLKEPLVKAVEVQDEGFQVVKGRNKGKKQSEKPFLVRPKTNLAYKQVPKQRMQGSWKRKQVDITKTSNSFNVLTNE
ncbi:zinc knuckle CX2CX4HX4C containing protein, partial [Tanacetum coccineum]